MAKKKLTASCYISIDGADPVPWNSLTQEEKENVKVIWSERLSRHMSAYYAQHMDEYARV